MGVPTCNRSELETARASPDTLVRKQTWRCRAHVPNPRILSTLGPIRSVRYRHISTKDNHMNLWRLLHISYICIYTVAATKTENKSCRLGDLCKLLILIAVKVVKPLIRKPFFYPGYRQTWHPPNLPVYRQMMIFQSHATLRVLSGI
jgi:hypothetical protein